MGEVLLATLNYFKLAFLNEDNAIANINSFVPFKSVIELFIASPLSFFEGILRPFPLSLSYGIFFIESMLQIFIIALLLKTDLKNDLYNPQFLIIFLTFFMGIVLNSLVIENDFTYVRYKYTFIYMFIIYLLVDKNKFKKTIM